MFERGSVIPYITAGDPDMEATLEFLQAVDEFAGAIELGIPFSDPMADGKIIQDSHHRALRNGCTVNDVFSLLRKFRKLSDTPVVLMTYYNPVYVMGVKNFVENAKAGGADGILVVDLPVSHASELLEAARDASLRTVFLAAPNTPNERLREIDEASSGFVYLISLYGTTGARNEVPESAFRMIRRARGICQNLIAVGFGVSRREHVESMIKEGADGVVVGSALMKLVGEHGREAAGALKEKMRELSGL